MNSSLLLLFLTSSLKFQDHGFTYLTFNTSPFGCFTTPHISVNLSHLRGIYSQKLSTSNISLLPPHPCSHYFLASFPILAIFNYRSHPPPLWNSASVAYVTLKILSPTSLTSPSHLRSWLLLFYPILNVKITQNFVFSPFLFSIYILFQRNSTYDHCLKHHLLTSLISFSSPQTSFLGSKSIYTVPIQVYMSHRHLKLPKYIWSHTNQHCFFCSLFHHLPSCS